MFKSNPQTDDEITIITSLYMRIGFITVGLLLLTAVVTAFLRPAYLGFERDANQQSQGYVEGHIAQMRSHYNDYLELESKIAETHENESLVQVYRAQQNSIKKDLEMLADQIPTDEIPPDIRMLISR